MRSLVLVAIASRVAVAGPALDHVVAAPTAWLPAANAGAGTAGLDRYGNAMIDVGYGLGRIAEDDGDRRPRVVAALHGEHARARVHVLVGRALPGAELGIDRARRAPAREGARHSERARAGDGRVGIGYAAALR